jgi:DNA-binding transcriptional MerR regulator
MPEDPVPVEDHVPAEEPVELEVLARLAGVRIVHVRRYLEFGLLVPEQPRGPASIDRFEAASAGRIARAERLRRDLGLNYAGAVLVVELLERISELEARVSRS